MEQKDKLIQKVALKNRKTYARCGRYVTSEEIKSLRMKMGLGFREFGELVGVSRQSICNWENTVTIPHRHHQHRLMELMGRDPDKEFANPPLELPINRRSPRRKLTQQEKKSMRKFIFNGEVMYFPKEGE